MKITKAELQSIIMMAGFNFLKFNLPDSEYQTCSKAFVVRNWNAWLAALPKELKTVQHLPGGRSRQIPLWVPEAGDCDNLALGNVSHAGTANAQTAVLQGTKRGGLTLGFLFYPAGPKRKENFNVLGGHAINWHVNHQKVFCLFEPGRGQHVTFNVKEKSKTWFGFAN